jgi:hypothetical protein
MYMEFPAENIKVVFVKSSKISRRIQEGQPVFSTASQKRRDVLQSGSLATVSTPPDNFFADGIQATAELLPVDSLASLQKLSSRLANHAADFDDQLAALAERQATGGQTAADRAALLSLASYASKNGMYLPAVPSCH